MFLKEAICTQTAIWCQWVTWFVLSRFDFVQIHILIERTKVVLQLVLPVRFYCSVLGSSSLGGTETRTRLSRSLQCQSSLLHVRQYLGQ